MARNKKTEKKPIEQYDHKGKKRVNNPPVGLVTPETDPDIDSRGILQKDRYAYDPHLDPQLQWSGKAEHTSFEIPTVSLHVHERIDPRTIIEAVPAPMVKAVDSGKWLVASKGKIIHSSLSTDHSITPDHSIARSGETLRQAEWRAELLRTGIRGKNGQFILFSRVEPFPGTRWLHADAETKPNDRGERKSENIGGEVI